MVKYWVAFNGSYFLLVLWLRGQVTYHTGSQLSLSVFLSLPDVSASAEERKRENEVICGGIDRQRGYRSGCCVRWRRVGCGLSNSLFGWATGTGGRSRVGPAVDSEAHPSASHSC